LSESTFVRRSLYLIACAAPVWAVIAYATDGIRLNFWGVRLSATEPIRPLILGAVAAAFYVWRYSRVALDADGRWLLTLARRAAVVAVPLIILLGCVIGIQHGTFTAGGSDSYGYVSQASLWMNGSLRVQQPWVQQFSWPDREWTFAPLGYRPLSADGTIVPTYAPGLPILMAAFQGLLGANGPFFVVPVFGALALWFTYLLGRSVTDSRTVGALAALLLLTSPVFLAQLLQPMTDVPVAAGWTLVALLAFREAQRETGASFRSVSAVVAGLVAGATLMIRPNLALLALVPLITWRGRRAQVLRFGVAFAPAIAAIAALNAYLYGSPFTSGYGAFGDLYSWTSAGPNLKRYGLWLVRTESPLVAFAIIPAALPGAFPSHTRTNARLCLGSLIGFTLMSYVFYTPFELWTYLRFLMPAYPALFVSMAIGIRFTCEKLPIPLRAAAAAAICIICLASTFIFTRDQFIFSVAKFEQRHIRSAEYVTQLTPETAVILCAEHSGSVRYYAHRITLRFDALHEDGLDAALSELRAKGYQSYIVVDDWEEQDFRKRFAAKNRAGRLDWSPIATVKTNPEVRIYATADYTEIAQR
jgi:hypothetical protein